MTKILFLAKLPPPYIGPTVANSIILNSTLKNDFELIHLDTSDHRDLTTLGIIDRTNIFLAIKHYFQLFYYLIKHNPDLVYSPIGQTTISYFRDSGFVLISKLFRKKIICHLRGGNFKNWYDRSSLITKWYVRKIHPLIDAQIVLGENLRKIFNWLIPDSKIFVVPNGGSYSFNYTKKENEQVKILYLANLIKSKGFLDLLYSTEFLNDYYDKLEVVFAGNWRDDKSKELFDEFVKAHTGLKVIITGQITGEKKFELLSSTDIFVFPTYYPNEGHPWVIIEAMAAGLPVITCDHAAISQSVKEGINGFIVEKQNPKQIADKLKLLIENKELRERMGKESRRLYEENFTEEKMVERLKNVFNTVLGERPVA